MISKLPLPFIFLILTNLVVSGTALYYCIDNDNNTSNSAYKSNLDALFSSLSKSVDDNGFYNASMGQNPNTAYANVLCRGDVQLQICRSCIQNATIEIVNSCPNHKQAVVWDEFCMLRYSNESMFGISTVDPPVFAWSMQNVSSPVQFMADVQTLIEHLRGQAALGDSLRKVAAGNKTTSNFWTVFSLVQCTPDLSSEDCDSCLTKAAGYIPKFCDGRRGCRSLQPSCNIRYEDVPFYNETRLQELQELITTPQLQPPPPSSLPTPSTPPGKKDDNTRTVIIASVSVVVGLTVVVLAIILLIKRAKKKPTEKLDSTGSSAFKRSSTQSMESLKTNMSTAGFRPR